MGVRPGAEWGTATDEAADVTVRGSDADLAAAVAQHLGSLIRFEPDAGSDLARAVGLRAGMPVMGRAVPLDVLRFDDGLLAVNMVIMGTPPPRIRAWSQPVVALPHGGRALAAVVANGQFHGGLDLAPRGHPGDGRGEFHTYRLRRGERSVMRRRLATGSHVPHPRIDTRTITEIVLSAPRGAPVEADGVLLGSRHVCRLEVVPGAYRLLL
jgi:hypothetical protein